MFEGLSAKLSDAFASLRGRGTLSPASVDTALVAVRRALIEADVALPVVKAFMAEVRADAIGEAVLKSVKPDQMVVKIVHDALVKTLGGGLDTDGDTTAAKDTALNLNHPAPMVMLMVGLQGSGKTTTTGKLARLLKTKYKKTVLLASLDVSRPAAREQLRILGGEAEVAVLPEMAGDTPLAITKRAVQSARLQSVDIVILDTAGRTTVDEALMAEVREISTSANPAETLLVADALTGQDAVITAGAFNEALDITGIILTRADGDARGGAALSMRQVTGCAIKFLGVGEKQDALEAFDATRMASRILGMGDIVGLVEKAQDTIEEAEATRLADRMAKGQFDMNDFLAQLRQLRKMGGMGGLMGLLPGIGKMKKQIEAAGLDDRFFTHQEAIILSMTKKERRAVGLLNASRRKRIAAGSGTSVQEVNKLVKQYQDMAKMMKRFGKMGGDAAGLPTGGFPTGGLPTGGLPTGGLASMLGGGNAGGMGMPGGFGGGFGGGMGGFMPQGRKKSKR